MKIFLGEKAVFLLIQKPENSTNSDVTIEYRSKKQIRKALSELGGSKEMNRLIIWSGKPSVVGQPGKERDDLYSVFFSLFKIIEASGGMVKNEKAEVLFIYKRNKWDLPKGKISSSRKSSKKNETGKVDNLKRVDKKEIPQDAAIREVMEETGLTEVKITRELAATYHIYHQKGRPVLKKTYWFEMFAPSGQRLIPDSKEGISEVKWISEEEMKSIAKNTYPSIRELLGVSCEMP